MPSVVDHEGTHFAALRRPADFTGARAFEVACGNNGRLTLPLADQAATVLAFDPDAAQVARAHERLTSELAGRLTYRVASGEWGVYPSSARPMMRSESRRCPIA